MTDNLQPEHKYAADNFLTPEVRERQMALYEASMANFPVRVAGVEKPVTTDLLQGIFARQGHFQALLGNETWKMDDGELVGYLKDQILAMLDESHEALNELGWKPWASSRHINLEEFKGELVDVLCFLVNLAMGVGLTANEFAALHEEKVGRNIKRQREGYDGVTGKCPGCNRAIDDLRAKGLPVGNFGGVDYCSTECIEKVRAPRPAPTITAVGTRTANIQES